ncbi:MAG: hypothetical protein JNJ73_18890 [Hyphomonadaceae bacterium]|nr:hypothetical protein [Hyphomonadaceae bacterium]
MLDLLVVTLLQAVAGPPADAPAATAPSIETVAPDPLDAEPPELTEAERRREEWRDRQRCRSRSTGAGRLGSRSCATRRSDEPPAPRATAQNTQGQDWEP